MSAHTKVNFWVALFPRKTTIASYKWMFLVLLVPYHIAAKLMYRWIAISVIPEALPRRFVSLKQTVTAKHNIINSQLTSGIYICPWIFDDVWITFTLGKQLNAEHCLMIENVPVIMAWLPTTAASMAMARTGHLNFSGKQKNENGQIAETSPIIYFLQQKEWITPPTWYRYVKPKVIILVNVMMFR